MPEARLQSGHRRDWPSLAQMGIVSSRHQVRSDLSLPMTFLTIKSLENWDEWARRQFQQKAPSRPHPYGDEDEPNHFRDFHIFERLRVLQHLAVWAFWNPDRMRQAMPDVKEADQYYDWVYLLNHSPARDKLTFP